MWVRFHPIILSSLLWMLLLGSAAANAEGAFAFAQWPNGGWSSGGSINRTNRAEAGALALQECNARGVTCELRATFRNTCFAFAIQIGGNGWATFESTDEEDAKRQAISRCRAMGRQCAIGGSGCDSIDEDNYRRQQAEIESNQRDAARQRADAYQNYVTASRRCFEGELTAALTSCLSALNFSNLTITDRAKIVERRDILTAQVQRENAIRNFRLDYDFCTKRYLESSCEKAADSEFASVADTAVVLYTGNVARVFKAWLANCRKGSALSCDRALQGPDVLVAPNRRELIEARELTSATSKAWAVVVPIGDKIAEPFEAAWDAMTSNVYGGTTISGSTLKGSVLVAFLAFFIGFVAYRTRNSPKTKTQAQPAAPKVPSEEHPPLPAVIYMTGPSSVRSDRKRAKPENAQTVEPPVTNAPAVSASPSPQTAYLLNLLFPGAGNIYFGQPVLGAVFILGMLFGLFMLFFGASAAMLGIMIIVVSLIAALFTFGLSLLIGLPIGFLFVLMGAGPILAFFIWLFSLLASELLVRSKAQKLSAVPTSSAI